MLRWTCKMMDFVDFCVLTSVLSKITGVLGKIISILYSYQCYSKFIQNTGNFAQNANKSIEYVDKFVQNIGNFIQNTSKTIKYADKFTQNAGNFAQEADKYTKIYKIHHFTSPQENWPWHRIS